MYMTFFVSYPISTRYSHISLRAKGPRAEMGRGLIWGMIRKCDPLRAVKDHIIIFLLYIFFFTICYFAFPSADNNFLILPSRLTNGLQFQL